MLIVSLGRRSVPNGQGNFAKDEDSAVDRFIFSRDGDKGTIVTNERNGLFGVYRYSFANGQIGETIFEDAGFDISDVRVDPATQEISGVRYHDDRWKTVWIDPKLKSLQAQIDRALPGSDTQDHRRPGNRRARDGPVERRVQSRHLLSVRSGQGDNGRRDATP